MMGHVSTFICIQLAFEQAMIHFLNSDAGAEIRARFAEPTNDALANGIIGR